MNAKKRLLIVVPYFPPHAGGTERFVLNMAKQLKLHYGWDITIVTTKRGKTYERAIAEGLLVHYLPYKYKLSNSPISLRWFGLLRSIIRDAQPDLINIHSPVPGLGDITALVAGKRPIVVNYHMGTMMKRKSIFNFIIWTYENAVVDNMLRKATHILSASEFVRNKFLASYRYKTTTVTPAVDTELFHPADELATSPHIVFNGSLNRSDRHKGLYVLLDACKQLLKDIPELKLTIVGDGTGQIKYEKQVSELGLDKVVKFAGRINHQELAGILRQASAFALPSSNDNAPLSIMEAMASGLPVVSTTVGGIPYIVDNGKSGLLVSPNNVTVLTEALKQVLLDRPFAVQLGIEGRKKAVSDLRWTKQASLTDKLFREAVGQLPTDNKTKVAEILLHYDPNKGGLQEYVHEISDGLLTDSNYDVFVVTPVIGLRRKKVKVIDGVTLYRLPVLVWYMWLPFNPFTRRLRKIFEHEQPSVVQIHMPISRLSGAALKAANGVPTVLTYHTSNMIRSKFLKDSAVRIYQNLFLEHMLEHATSILVVSPAVLRTKWREYRYKTNIVVPRVVASLFSYGQRSKSRGGSQTTGLVLVGDGDDVDRNVARSGTAKAFKQHVIAAHVTALKQYLKNVATHPVSIVQIISYYPPHIGGAEKVAEAVSLELANRGYVVQVVTSNLGNSNRTKQKEEQDSRFRIRRLSAIEFAHTPIMPSYIWSLVRVKKPTIFHLHLTHAYTPELMWLVAKVRRIPYVVHFHLDADPSGPFGILFKPYKRFIHPIIFHGAAHVITLSPEQADMIRERYDLPEDRVSFLPNGVGQKFLDIGKKPRTPHSPLRLLYVGRISPQKRIDRLVEALALVKGNVHVTIVGDGYLKERLEKRSQELGLKNMEWLGFKEGQELLDLYTTNDAFVLPSDVEGMPLVMFEAMAVGMPVIGSDVQGIREHLKGTGIVVNNPSPETFAAAIDDFNDHIDELYGKLSRASREKAAQYSWTNLTERLETVYRKISPVAEHRRVKRHRLRLLAGVGLWWLAFLGLRLSSHVPPAIVNVVGFSFLVLIPGTLTMMCFKLEELAAWSKLTLAVALSVLELMAVAVIGNSLLQWFGVVRPLDTPYLIAEISVLLVILGGFVWHSTKNWQGLKLTSTLSKHFPTSRDWLATFIPVLLVVMSIFGANTLNNDGSDIWVMAILGLMGLYSLVLFWISKRLSDTAIAVSMYFMALALLLSTSLRGWLTTGHDIQVEYQVFQLAKTNGVWQIQIFRNAYNACLSITILPTVLANLLKVFDPYVFKIYYQVIFATVPPLLYLFARKWFGKGLAFLAALYFIAFPTFFTDMPFLNRQEIAFMFFALMLYMIFQDHIKLSVRRGIFLLLSVGLIFAHYSTTYSVIIILGFAVVSWPFIEWFIVGYKKRRHIALSAHRSVKRLTLSMLIIIGSMSFIWSTVLTQTSNNSVLVIHETYLALTDRLQGGAQKSNDTNYSLLSWKNASPSQQLDEYVNNIVNVVRSKSPQSYYPASDYQNMNIKATTDQTQPLTWFGRFVQNLGINVQSANYAIRQGSAKLLQVLVVAGIIYMIMRKKYASWLDGDYISLTLGCIVFMGLQVVLPVLSVEYGLLRAFQQSLMLLGLFTVLGSVALFAWLPNRILKIAGPAIIAVLFFFSSTGVFTQLTGGYQAQLNLNNAGSYYDLYYTHPQEVAAIQWLNNDLLNSPGGLSAHPEVQTDAFTVNRLLTYTQLPIINDLYPGLIKRDAYVYLGYADLTTQQASVAYSGNTISYTYPMKFLNQQKDLIYDNGGAEIYR